MPESLEELRRRGFAIAYRMLGSVSEAEDVVQEALLRLHKVQEGGEHIESPLAFLSTVVTRLAIDELRSARARRERYMGEWLPEPLLISEEADPARRAEMADSLSLAFLVLLESLSPEQRAVFLLREVFDYPYERIAQIVGRDEAAVRQLASRARRRVEERKPRFESSREQRERLADRFYSAVEHGDVKSLESLLAADVVLHGDGGGKVRALGRPVQGRSRVAQTLLAWARIGTRGGATVRPAEINGQPGAIALDRHGRLISVLALDVAGGQIESVLSVVNPNKLRHLGLPVADVEPLFGGRSDAPS